MKKSLIYIILILFIPSIIYGDNLYEEQLDKGLENSDAYSFFLIEKSRSDPSKAEETLITAMRYSPNLPAVYFELSKVTFSFSTQGIFQSFDYMIRGINTYTKNFWWSFIAVGSLFISFILSILLSIIIIVIVRLFRDMPLLSHDIMEQRSRIFLFLILLSAAAGPLLFIGGVLILLGIYMKRKDRFIVYLYLLFLLLLPLILKTSSVFFSIPSSNLLKGVVLVNESKNNRYALTALKNKNDDVALFSYALALKREGRYDEAIKIYNKLVSKKPDSKIYINLANCYFAIGEIETAKQLYEKAIQIKPLVSAFYNLSQIARISLDLEKGEEYFLYAQRLDSKAVSKFQSIFGHNPNRFVIDEVIPTSDIWRYAFRKEIKVSNFSLSTIPLSIIPFIAFFFILLFYMLNKHIKQRAYKCHKCGTILCARCEKKILWGNMCPECFKTLVRLHELDARERIARLQLVYEHQKRNRRMKNIFSFLMPGFAHIYAGEILNGLFFLWIFLFLISILVLNSIFITGEPYSSHIWIKWVSISLLIIIYFVSNIMTRRRISRGWL
ncbi:MAG: tetratricopeptide repeat protein [Nitrospirae bacterium]|nr:tetratricopeptide repeat protein [Nitrospirota bacterium]